MRTLALALALAGALCAARAADYALQDLDSGEPGIARSVRQILVAAPLQDVFEHAVKPMERE
jgi:hypothetical protein